MEIASGDVVLFNGGLLAHRVAAVAGDTSDTAMGSEAQMAPYVRLNCQVRVYGTLPYLTLPYLTLPYLTSVSTARSASMAPVMPLGCTTSSPAALTTSIDLARPPHPRL